MELICKSVRKLFPPDKDNEVGFMLCLYSIAPADRANLDLPFEGAEFKAKGPLLPYCDMSTVTLHGEWDTQGEDPVFSVSSYDEEVPDFAFGARAYLATLDGCDSETANRIANHLGEAPMSKLDNALDSILDACVKSQTRRDKIRRAYQLRRIKRDVFFYVVGLLPKRCKIDSAVKTALSARNVEDVQADPFRFAMEGCLPFNTAKRIALASGDPVLSPRGIEAAVLDALRQAEGCADAVMDGDGCTGHCYQTVEQLQESVGNALNIDKNDPRIIEGLQASLDDGYTLCADGRYVYRIETCNAEYGIVDELVRLMSFVPAQKDYKEDIYRAENLYKLRLAPEQRAAVKLGLASSVMLLTGGPGVGKTTIERVICRVFLDNHPDEKILLIAPTGKAARQMSESCGMPAHTVYKALNCQPGDEVLESDVTFDAGLILVDEASMLDNQQCWGLLKAVKDGAQLIFVGDPDQLPSVRAGNVLAELINSKAIPNAHLETVYRQKAGSTIAVNCARIRRGNVEMLEEDGIFEINEVSGGDAAVQMVLNQFQAEMRRGLTADDICLLSPYRKATATGVNQINPMLQTALHPNVDAKAACLKYGAKVFYVGDRVMCMVNTGNVANGDVGVIVDIQAKKFTVNFGGGSVEEYSKNAIRNFDLAYATTIHKSQGSEWKSVIIVVMNEHKRMLKRNLLYTAVSRAKTKVTIIGSREALNEAINTEDSSKRQSRIGTLLKKAFES